MKESLIIYKASAGSGKTFTLAQNYLVQLLSKGGSHRYILAVTFTNKATTEMKQRILAYLYDLAEGRDNDFTRALAERLGQPADLKQRAQAALDGILHDYDHFQVMTIDKFFQQLLSNLAHELGLSANYRIELDDRKAVDEAVDFLLDAIDERADKKLIGWIEDLIEDRMRSNKGWSVGRDLKNFSARNVLSEAFQLRESDLRNRLNDAERMRRYRQTLRARLDEAQGALTGAAQNLIDELDGMSLEGFSRKGQYVYAFARKLLNGDLEEPTKSVCSYIEDPQKLLNKNVTDDGRAANVSSRLAALVDLLHDKRRTILSCRLILKNLNQLFLLNAVAAALDLVNKANSRFLLAKTKLLFHEMVGEQDAPFVFERAGAQLRHILIDEFQDTARLQWNNIKSLLLNNLAEGNTCLLVGDVKQSIYRWNGGDWNILQNIEKEYPAARVNSLRENYRSGQHIIDFNNAFFPAAAQMLDRLETEETDDAAHLLQDIYADVSQVCPRKTADGYVSITLHDAETDVLDAEAEASLYQQIQMLRQTGVAYTDMAILVRRNKEAQAIAERFAEQHLDVPLASAEAFLLSASPVVQLLISALRCLMDEKDTLSQAVAMRIYCNHILAENRPMSDIAEAGSTLLPAAFVRRRADLAEMPLFELIEQLILIFTTGRSNECIDISGESAYITAFLDQVLAFLDENPSSIEAFLNFWDEEAAAKTIPSTAVDGIRILTIHKSKGLAFHTVLIPFCDWDIFNTKQGSRSTLWVHPQESPYDELPTLPIEQNKAAAQSIFQTEYEQELLMQKVDGFNAAYVAFTRPKKNLLIWANVPSASNKPTFGSVIASFADPDFASDADSEDAALSIKTWGAIVPSQTAGKQAAEAQNPFDAKAEAVPFHFTPQPVRAIFKQSNKSKDFVRTEADPDDLQQSYIDRGKRFHRLLSDIDTVEDLPRAFENLRREGLSGPDDAEDLAFLRKRLMDAKVSRWFDGSWQLFNEHTILSRNNNQLSRHRPDRVLVKDKQAVVIDFKFGAPAASHATQVKTYMHLLQTMGYESVTGRLWYVYQNKVESISL